MKLIITFCLILFSTFYTQVIAQKTVRVYYTREEIATLDSVRAAFYLDLQMHGDTLYKYTEYSTSGIIRAEGFANKAVPFLQRHRNYSSYYPNQELQSTGTYSSNVKVGIWRKFYQNGNVEEVGAWVKNIRPNEPPIRCEVVTYADSTGHVEVMQGNGSLTKYFPNGSVSEKGTYRDGLKDSVWVGYFENGSIYYEETYLAGILQQGKSRDKEGNEYQYSVAEEPVSFRQENVFQFLSKIVKYPVQAQRMGIQGMVFISFLVNQEGMIYDLQVHDSPHPLLTEEAVRAIGLTSGGWKPATLRGQIIAQRHKFPVSFFIN